MAQGGFIVYNRADDNTDLAGTVSGAGGVIQRGSGVTTITSSHSYTGSTVLAGGVLAVSRDANLGSGGALVFDGGTLRLNDDFTFDSNRAVTVQSSGVIDTLGNTVLMGGVISGAGTLTKQGGGVLILTGENTFNGNTIINAGVLQIGDGTSPAGYLTGDVTNNATLVFNRTGSKTFDGTITGSGGLIQRGGTATAPNITVLTANSAYSGGITIEEHGVLKLGAGGATGDISGDVLNHGTLMFDRSSTKVFAGVISGSGTINQAGPGVTIFKADHTYSGGTQVSGGALQLGDGGGSGSILGGVLLGNGGKLIFNRSDDLTGPAAFSGVVSGIGALVKDGGNVLELAADNTYIGGTELRRGTLLFTGRSALGNMSYTDSLAGHVLFVGECSDSARIFEVAAVDRNGDLLIFITNHFHVAAGQNNTFQTNADLQISNVINQDGSGGAFYVEGGAVLDINVGRDGQNDVDLVLAENYYNNGERDIANDIYVDGTLNLNVAGPSGNGTNNAVFIERGTAGSGTLNINGPGIMQIEADSSMGVTNVRGAALRVVYGATYANNDFDLDANSSLQGNGFISGVNSITIGGNLSPDSDILDPDHKTVEPANRAGKLQILGADTILSNFSYTYDAVAPNTDNFPYNTQNDLVQFGSQNVYIAGGTVDFVTDGGAGLNGRYLVFDSSAANYLDGEGNPLNVSALNSLLKGLHNGVAFAESSPRSTYRFDFNSQAAQNQIWLDAARNSLLMVWQDGDGDWLGGNWQSIQQNSGTYAKDFINGDKVILAATPGDARLSLNDDIIVSGLTLGTETADAAIAHIEIGGAGGISARKNTADIVGVYAKTDGSADSSLQQFNTTGKLEIRGGYNNSTRELTTLTIANTGRNTFEEGIDLYSGRLVLNGPDGRLGVYNAATGNAGLVSFLGNNNGSRRILVITGQNQTLHNKIVIGAGLADNYLLAEDVTAVLGNLVEVGANAHLTIGGTGGVIVQTGINGAAGSTLHKDDVGTLQFDTDSYIDSTNAANGILRVRNHVTYGNGDSTGFELSTGGTLAGAGTVLAKTIHISGTLSPDNLDAADPAAGIRYGTLTLQAGGTGLTMNGATLDFEADGPTSLSGGRPANQQDLLVLQGMQAELTNFTINMQTLAGEVFGPGDYLVIKSSHGYSLINNLQLTVNGAALTAGSPRGALNYELRDSSSGTTGGDKKDLWLVNALSSLTMDWTGGAAGSISNPVSGNWVLGVDRMLSAQDEGGLRENVFMNGDKVHIFNSNGGALTVSLTDDGGAASNVTVSGLVVGQSSSGVLFNNNVVIDGPGGITADADSAFGKYLTNAPVLLPTGKLQKYGAGTLTLANSGGNRFLGGAELFDGVIVIGHQLALGAYTSDPAAVEGYLTYSGSEQVTRTIEISGQVERIQNHFEVLATGGTNVFHNRGDLIISSVDNRNSTQPLAWPFTSAPAATLPLGPRATWS